MESIRHATLDIRKKYFINKANKIHNNQYDYSEVNFINIQIPVLIHCKIHGPFKQTPNNHLYRGCSKCKSGSPEERKEEFFRKLFEKFGNKFDYSTVKYVNNYTKTDFICKIHGKFNTTPMCHYDSITGCPSCTKELVKIQQKQQVENFYHETIELCKKIHNNRYEYSNLNLLNYKNITSFITIICPFHREFSQRLFIHKRGHGCTKCSTIKKIKKTTASYDEAIKQCQIKHNYLYEYPIKNKDSYITKE